MASRIRRWLLPLVLITGCSCSLAQTATEPGAPGATVWGGAVNGLEMSLFFDPQQTGASPTPQLRIGLRNVGSTFNSFVLGSYCGLGRIEPNSVALILTDDRGKSQRLEDLGLGPAVSGPATPHAVTTWNVPLPPGASFSTPINLDNFRYFSEVTGNFETGWQSVGQYSLQAEAELYTNSHLRACVHQGDAHRSIKIKSNELQVGSFRPVARTDEGPQLWGDAVNGLQTSIYLAPQQVGTSQVPAFRVGLRNVGSSDISVWLGGHCGPGGFETSAIHVILTDSQGQSHALEYWGPNKGDSFCAGVLSVWVVPLSPGASFSIPIDLTNYKYLSRDTNTLEPGWKPGGTYFLQTELETRKGFPNKSNQLQIHFPAE